MTIKPELNGRTNPPGNDQGSDTEEDVGIQAEDVAGAKFRSKVVEYQNQLQFPTSPLYRLNEEVFCIIVGQPRPAGPFLITAILANRHYKLKRKDTGEAVNQSVAEDDLVIRIA